MLEILLCLLMLVAAAVGFLAAEAAELPELRTRFWKGSAVSVLIALAGAGLIALNGSEIRRGLAEKITQRIPDSDGPLRSILQLRPEQIPAGVLWFLAMAFFFLMLFFFLLAFNCRRRAENRWFACGWTVLFGAIVSFIAIWGCYGISPFLLLLNGDSQTFPYLGIAIAYFVLTTIILAGWTFFALRNRKTGWRRLLAQAGIIAGINAGIWLLGLAVAYPYGLYALHCAEKEHIVPWYFQVKLPPELEAEKAKIDRFCQKHENFALPINDVYNWKKRPGVGENNLIPKHKREYTLKLFDTPECEAFIALYEKFIRNQDNDGAIPTLNYIRAYVRIRAGRAALYSETGRPEKILPEFRKAAELDFGQTAPKTQLDEMVHIAIRYIWVSTLMNIGPDGPEYAPFYREMLDKLKSCKIYIPDDAGFFLPMLKAGLGFTPATYAGILSAPGRIALTANGVLHALSVRKMVPELAKTEVLGAAPVKKSQVRYARDLALRSRSSLVLGTTGLALKLYRSEKGHYPQTLEELVPEYLEKLPPCPFTGEPLLYESDGKNFELRFPDPERGKFYRLSTEKNY